VLTYSCRSIRMAMSRTRARAIATTALLSATVSLAVPAPASAAPADTAPQASESTIRSVRIGRATIQAGAKTVPALRKQIASEQGLVSDVARTEMQRVTEHLDEAARNGRLVDESALRVSSVPDPLVAGELIQLAWEGEKAPEAISYHEKASPEGDERAVALGIELGGEADGPARRLTTTLASGTGSGFGAGYDVKNLRKAHNLCSDVWFDARSDLERDHKMTSCYEDWEQDRTPHFIYNRWTLWTPAPGSGIYSYTTRDLYIASRPWRGKEGNFRKLNSWEPRRGNRNCIETSPFTLSGTYAGVTGSASFPMHSCEEYQLDITASKFKIGMQFYGSTKGQMYMDVAGDYTAINSTVPLVWADYNWVEVQQCISALCSGAKEQWVYKDSGW
jgi:hypothetical protein